MKTLALALALACATPALAADDSSYGALADRYWNEYLADNPELATSKGVHAYDAKLTDFSPAAVKQRLAALHAWRDRFAAVDASALSPDDAADLETMRANNESSIVSYEDVREWQRHPRLYTSDAHRGRLPHRQARLRAGAAAAGVGDRAREADPGAAGRGQAEPARRAAHLRRARARGAAVEHRVSAEGHGAGVRGGEGSGAARPVHRVDRGGDARAGRTSANGSRRTSCRRPRTDFAIGADAFVKKLGGRRDASPSRSTRVLARGEAELARLREEFVATAKKIDPTRPAQEVQASLAADHGKPETLLADVQARLAGLRKFLVDQQIVTIPSR